VKFVTLAENVGDDGILSVPETVTPPPSSVMFLLFGMLTFPVHPLPLHRTVSPELALLSAVWTVEAEPQSVVTVAAHAGPQRTTPTRNKRSEVSGESLAYIILYTLLV
jgi:hypothetical protein